MIHGYWKLTDTAPFTVVDVLSNHTFPAGQKPKRWVHLTNIGPRDLNVVVDGDAIQDSSVLKAETSRECYVSSITVSVVSAEGEPDISYGYYVGPEMS